MTMNTSANPTPALLTLDSVETDIGGSRILRGVSLEVRPGEVVALMGRNGCGKSSLLWALQGSGTQTAGTVHVLRPPVGRSANGTADATATSAESGTASSQDLRTASERSPGTASAPSRPSASTRTT